MDLAEFIGSLCSLEGTFSALKSSADTNKLFFFQYYPVISLLHGSLSVQSDVLSEFSITHRVLYEFYIGKGELFCLVRLKHLVQFV